MLVSCSRTILATPELSEHPQTLSFRKSYSMESGIVVHTRYLSTELGVEAGGSQVQGQYGIENFNLQVNNTELLMQCVCMFLPN